MLPTIIETKRLVLRPWRLEDVTDVLAYASDDEWSRYLPVPRPYEGRDAKEFVTAQLSVDRRERGSWAIDHDGAASGGVSLRLFHGGRVGEIGFTLARILWGRGRATEAARAVVSGAFEALPDLVRVRAVTDSRNRAALRVLDKIPMRREGVLRSNRFLRNEPVDEVWCGTLRSEWDPATGGITLVQ